MTEPMPVRKTATPIDFEPEVQSDVKQIQGRTIIEYADSGDGKTTRAHSLARYYYRKSGGKRVRLVAAEDSTKAVFQDLIDAGIVEPFFMLTSKSPLVTLDRIVEGEWPKDGKWEAKKDWEGDVSAYIFEGLTTFSEVVLDYLRNTNRFPREQKDAFTDSGRTYMAASQTAFGFTQSYMIEKLKWAGMLPVDRVLWTAHEAKGNDEFEKNAIRGPKLVGSAATDTLRKYVGTLLHTDRVNGLLRTYVVNHPDLTNPKTLWKAKLTVPPSHALEVARRFKDGFFTPELPVSDYSGKDGLIPFLEWEAETRTDSGNAAMKFKEMVNG